MRIKLFLLIISGSFFSVSLYSQKYRDSATCKELRSFVKLNFTWGVFIEWEKRINKSSVILMAAGEGLGFAADGFSLSHISAPIIASPGFDIEYRNYYNYNNRIKKGKKTAYNSANFLFGRIDAIMPVKNQNYLGIVFSQGWGIQRQLWKKVLLCYHLGVMEHIYYDKPPDGGFNFVKLEPLSSIDISFTLF
jgi:hypothetical protein